VQFSELGADDRALFSAMKFGKYRRWERRVDHMIREDLAGAISEALGNLTCLGIMDGEALAAVAAWMPDIEQPDIVWDGYVIGVDRRYRENGYGRALMHEMLLRAANAGVLVVTSLVHNGNKDVLAWHLRLGADIAQDTDDGDLMVCTIPVQEWKKSRDAETS